MRTIETVIPPNHPNVLKHLPPAHEPPPVPAQVQEPPPAQVQEPAQVPAQVQEPPQPLRPSMYVNADEFVQYMSTYGFAAFTGTTPTPALLELYGRIWQQVANAVGTYDQMYSLLLMCNEQGWEAMLKTPDNGVAKHAVELLLNNFAVVYKHFAGMDFVE